MNFRRSVIVAELWQPEVVRLGKSCHFLRFLDNFQNSVPTKFTASPIDVLCSNFVKVGRRESGKIVRCLIVRCLPDKNKTKFRLALQLLLLPESRP